MKSLTILFIALFLLTGCSTDTGNPGGRSGDKSLSSLFTGQLVGRTCSLLSQCNSGLQQEDCRTQLYEGQALLNGVGTSSEQYSTYLSVAIAELNEEILVDSTASFFCLASFEALRCSDQKVQNAYNDGLVDPFEKVSEMIPNACRTVLDFQEE